MQGQLSTGNRERNVPEITPLQVLMLFRIHSLRWGTKSAPPWETCTYLLY